MKRQRAKQRPLYRYDVYRGRRRGQARLIGAAGCAVFGLLLVLIRSLGIRFSGFLLLGWRRSWCFPGCWIAWPPEITTGG